jgi:SAM-dependent methyltransferase
MAGTNNDVFRSSEVVRSFIGAEGWLEDGERTTLLSVAPLVRDRPILDIGVGLGRTASLLRLVSDSYVAIDYSPEMVQLCHELHPDVDVRFGDASDLSQFADGQFQLVFFSNYGVDALDAVGRRRFLSEAHRVLGDGGILVHNTMNKHGRLYGEKPWQLHAPGQPPDLSARRIAGWCWHNLRDPMRAPRRYRNWFANRRSASDHGEWATCQMSAHDFSLVVYYVTLTGLRAELDESGFDIVAVYDCPTGAVIDAVVARSDGAGFYAVGRKRAADAAGPAARA